MADRILVGTRKGLFILNRKTTGWDIAQATLLGDPITMLLADRADDLHVAVEHGHYGVKLKRSRDGGQTWEDRPTPQYPPKPDTAGLGSQTHWVTRMRRHRTAG